MRRLVRVAGQSMAPTYRPSDLLLTRPVELRGARIAHGDVVVFRRGGVRVVKRVVALPGDVVEMEAGRLSVNGVSADERPRLAGPYTQAWTVPGDSYFVAGDNAVASDDSRVWDEPFVAAGSVESVVTRRLTPRRLVAATVRVG